MTLICEGHVWHELARPQISIEDKMFSGPKMTADSDSSRCSLRSFLTESLAE